MAVLSRLSWPSGCAASLCSYRRDKFAGHSKHRLAFAVTQLSAELDEGYRIEKFRNELETQETLVSKRPCRSHERQRVGLAVCGRGLFGRAVRRAPHTACQRQQRAHHWSRALRRPASGYAGPGGCRDSEAGRSAREIAGRRGGRQPDTAVAVCLHGVRARTGCRARCDAARPACPWALSWAELGHQ